jgi:FHA domain
VRVNESVLTILKYCFLALLYLFLLRVVRVVHVELGGGARRAARAQRRMEQIAAQHDNAHAPVPADAASRAPGAGFGTTSYSTQSTPAIGASQPLGTSQPIGSGVDTSGGRGRDRRRGQTGPARLVVLEPPELAGRVHDVAGESLIGRATTCEVVLVDDTYVSQVHARIFVHDGQLFVEDLGSTNGTYLNRARVDGVMALHRGDHVQIGRTLMEVS